MKQLIIQVLEESFSVLEKQTPKSKKQIKSISIINVSPLDLISFMKKHNIPDSAFFNGRDNGYDAFDDILLSWEVDIPTSEKDKFDFGKRRYSDIVFPKIYKIMSDNNYNRKPLDTSLLKDYKNTTVYEMFINRDFDRIVEYYSMYFERK